MIAICCLDKLKTYSNETEYKYNFKNMRKIQ